MFFYFYGVNFTFRKCFYESEIYLILLFTHQAHNCSLQLRIFSAHDLFVFI